MNRSASFRKAIQSPPMIEEEYMVSANQRSEKKIVSKPGEYKISIRYKDGYADFARGISKEDVDVVQCRNRPRPPCREVRKFPYRKIIQKYSWYNRD